MVAWAASGKFDGTGFLCVCVDPDALGTATEFSQLYFSAAPKTLVNGYIDSRNDFPNFEAQLGCQGFVIFDGNHKLVTQRTAAWTQYRDGAFREVETRLAALLNPTFGNPLNAPVGQRVKVIGLTSEAGKKLNGEIGEVVGSADNGRYVVKFASGTQALKPQNLEDAAGAPVGKKVKIHSLTSEKGRLLNGQVGEVVGGAENGRYLVRLNDGTIAFRPENLQEVRESDDLEPLTGVPSVEHEGMDDEHVSCINALNALVQELSVKALRRVREELAHHFEDEENLLRSVGFGGVDKSDAGGTMTAFGSHVADHKRIVALADDELSALSNACETSEGAVRKHVARDLCRAFVEHATMYDSLYVDKLHSKAV